ncbi:LutC/YkgG family protein [Falsarthrobacter nasiphocae]|uniref:L-lactate dehydrogenase complex protein LldG n=1 Tax=Falsarthrobacter nasiphocae TaxID=189863 RepID=A0AAE3YHG4_9MICC|nr:LUD domain-containing protein [Falsarthrobacter nasiphocae]MDR6892280.1 L-lactate dehydrogenase complex protein LldG [Falsarthrobacter nasiphocae]
MSSREDILTAVREAMAGAPEAPAPARDYRFTSGLSRDQLREQLVDRLVDYKANVVILGSASEIPEAVRTRLAGAERVVVPAGLDMAWTDEVEAEIVVDGPERALSVEELDATSAVLTASAAACSETGTIFLDTSADQGRRAITLVPDHHVVVVSMDDVRGLLPETLATLDSTRPLTWISGPSATSDIELERVEGVHGPRRLDVLLVG